VASIRARAAGAYAAALSGTLALFAGTLWVARGASGDRELQRYVNEEAEVAVRLLGQARGPGLALTEVQDPLVGPLAVVRVQLLLDVLPNIVLVTDTAGRVVYGTPEARVLAVGGASALVRTAAQLNPTLAGKFQVTRDTAGAAGAYARARGLAPREQVLVVRRDVGPDLAPLRSVIVATPTRSARRAQQELLGAALAIGPVVLLLSAGAAWWIAGRAVRPLDRMVTELEAITDGRSLHRRLAIGGLAPGEPESEGADELARLGATVNAMIGRLETSFAALRRFTADASHELKTPLTVMRATVERAMGAPPNSAEQFVALEEALQEISRMAALVDSLLTLARFDEGRFDLHREPVALRPLVRDVAETAHLLGEASGLTIEVSALEPATVLGDPMRLRQLFLNLVTNAIKYTAPGGHVELALRQVEGAATFSVRDTGMGIAAADLPYIFDRFWRADRARSRRVGGAEAGERGGFGLGLAISQWIAQAHGGHIAVASRLTRGTTFTVTLPVPSEPAGDASPGDVAGAGVSTGADRASIVGRSRDAAIDLIES
jgi:signal transduction histidine kinase